MSDLEKIFMHSPKGTVKLGVLRGDRKPRWFNKDGKYFNGTEGWSPTEYECVTLAVRSQQTKTVADAVEYYNSNFPEGHGILGIAYSNNKIIPYYSGSPIADGTCSPKSYIICTRDEFEAYVKEQQIDISNMREGMVVKCVRADSNHYTVGEKYVVGMDKGNYFGPLNKKGLASVNHRAYSFESVEAEQEGEKWTHEYHGDNCKIVHQEKWQAWIISEKGLSKLVHISELRKPKPTITKDQAWDYAVDSGLTAEEIEKTHTVV